MFSLSLHKTNLLRWLGWFSLGNILLFWLIGLRYFATLYQLPQEVAGANDGLLIVTLTILAYLSHFALLALIPCLSWFRSSLFCLFVMVFLASPS
jgi:hypothetical protein